MSVSHIAGTLLLLSDARLVLSSSAWWFIGAALLALLVSWAVYRFTLPPVSRWRKSLLWILRGVALTILILLLFEPVLRYLSRHRENPVVALLVDESASMSARPAEENRVGRVGSFLRSPTIRDLQKSTDFRSFAFADSVHEVNLDSLDALSYKAVGSDLAGAWTRVAEALSAENVAAFVVVSDGAYNMGANPAREAAHSTIPIYTLGVGDTMGTADAAISEMLTNEIAYVGSTVPLDVRVRGIGLAGKQAQLRLVGRNGEELSRELVRFDDNDAEFHVAFTFQTDVSGDLRVMAVLDSVAGESLLDNNRRSVVIRVLEKKSSVFFFFCSPGPDLTELRQVFEQDTTLEVRSWIEKKDGDFLYGALLPSAEQIADARLLVLINFPTRSTPAVLLDRIARVVRESRIPLLFLAGPNLATSRLTPLAELLPLEALRVSLVEEPVILRSADSHPVFAGTEVLPASWTDLPPVFGGVGNFAIGATAQIPVKMSRENLGLIEDEPALVLWEIASRRGAAFLCWGTSRWRLQMAESATGSSFYEDLMQRLRAWLIAPVEEQSVRIRPVKRLFSGGESIRFVGEVYGGDLRPRDDAVAEVQVRGGSRTENLTLHGRGNGRYEGALSPWLEGDYRFNGTARIGEDTLGTDNGMFAVEAFNIELVDPRARFDILRQVAQASGGAFASLADADSVLKGIDISARQIEEQRELPLWNRASIVWLIILLLSLEWIIRKRSGML